MFVFPSPITRIITTHVIPDNDTQITFYRQHSMTCIPINSPVNILYFFNKLTVDSTPKSSSYYVFVPCFFPLQIILRESIIK